MTRRLVPFVVIAAVVSVASAAILARPSHIQAPQAAQEDEFLKGVLVLDSGPGTTPPAGVFYPKVKFSVRPKYTRPAMSEKIQGQVELQVVVGVDGRVARARVVKSLDQVYGLDESAIAAALVWTFEPAMRNGEPVAVAVNLVLEFRLH